MIELENFTQNTCRKFRERRKEFNEALGKGSAKNYEEYSKTVGYLDALEDCENILLSMFDDCHKKTLILKQEQGEKNAK